MKASIKLREDEQKLPLLRAKVPISIFSLPFAACIAAGDPSDLSFNLLTSFPSLPSLKLSYHPNLRNTTNPNPSSNPFTLTLKSGIGHLGSPSNSPLQISFHLSPSPNPSFSIHLKPHIGHFSLSKAAVLPALPNPNPNPKENGGGVHHPIPVASVIDRSGFDELVRSGVGVMVRTEMPVGRRAGLKVRWAVKLPPEVRGSGILGRLPYLTVDKISIERSEEVVEEVRDVKEWSDKDFEAMRGMCFWMGREVEEQRKESNSIREGIEAVKKKFLELNGNYEREGRKNVGNVRNAAEASNRGSNGGFAAAGKRA